MKISQIYPAAHRKNEILLIMVVEIIRVTLMIVVLFFLFSH